VPENRARRRIAEPSVVDESSGQSRRACQPRTGSFRAGAVTFTLKVFVASDLEKDHLAVIPERTR